MFGEIFLKIRQTNWNVAINNVNVVDEQPNQIKFILLKQLRFGLDGVDAHQRGFMLFVPSTQNGRLPVTLTSKKFTLLRTPLDHRKALSENYAMHIVSC